MIRQVVKINWKYLGDSLPSFITMVMMAATYSVAYGLIA
jgi:adenine/guanine/hypoxanthine permease